MLRSRFSDATLLLLAIALIALVLAAVLGLHHLAVGDDAAAAVHAGLSVISRT